MSGEVDGSFDAKVLFQACANEELASEAGGIADVGSEAAAEIDAAPKGDVFGVDLVECDWDEGGVARAFKLQNHICIDSGSEARQEFETV